MAAPVEVKGLQEHNRLRALHGVPPLKLNGKLTVRAQKWADYLAKKDKMEHNSDHTYGENIYFSQGQKVTGDMPVKAWYDEINNYDFAKAEFKPETGHFTQVIWKDTTEVGMGMATKGDKVWVVANYNPPGNAIGLFKENVPPKK